MIERRSRVVAPDRRPARRPSPVVCKWYVAGASAVALGSLAAGLRSTGVGLPSLDTSTHVGTTGYQVCTNRTTGASNGAFRAVPAPVAAAPAITPQMLAQRASAQLQVDVPAPATSPGLDQFQLVGLPTWLWVKAWDTVANTAAIPGLSATVSARPVRSTWDFGAGGRVTCDGPGTPFDIHRPASNQSTDCALTFIQSGTYTARVTVDWAVSWKATTGGGGALPPLARTTTFPIQVRAAQAVTD
ncbi:MAG: hypothetical protein M3Z46_01880 [Actinomycetota bacterium]|nr:hypothetical protein [Actinomycetota bacterium]